MIDTKPLILNLNKVNQKDRDLVGSKAGNLGMLIQNGFSIPDGFVLTTQAYSQFLKHNNLIELIKKILSKIDYTNYKTIEVYANQIQDAFKKGNFSIEILDEIKDNYDKFLTSSVAIRSSATSEDLPTASFAGQYDTFLNLKTISHVIQSIKDCYASFWTSRAIVYRMNNKISHINAKLAIIIQKMIPAKCAGVLFTSNPISMNKNELIIESNYGLGESIVSGRCSPDRFLVKKESHHGKEEYLILDTQIGKKNVAIYPKTLDKESGTELVQLSKQENIQSSLSDKIIIRLSKLGAEIVKYFKTPQDIEWAIDQNDKIYILQSRPITTKVSIDFEEDIWFTRGYADDYWNDPVTPLFFDLLGDPLTTVVSMELNSIMGYKGIEKKLLRLYNGHVYFNLNVLKNRVKYEIPKIFRNEDLLNYFPEGSGPYGKETMKNLPFRIFRRLLSEIRIMLHDPNGAMTKTDTKYYSWTENEFEPFIEQFDIKFGNLTERRDLRGLIELADTFDRVMVAHYRLIRYGLAVHNIGMNLMVQYLLTRFLGKEKSLRLYPVLISGLENKLTETNDEIQFLASIIRKSPELKSIILEYESNKIYEYISSERDPTIQVFFKEFEKFLKNYGDRGFSREIYYPRWSEAPQYVFDILKTLVKGQEQEFKKIKEKNLEYQGKIETYVEGKIRVLRFGLIKLKLLLKILGFSRKYINFRENQRFNLDHWICRIRKLYLEIGKILKQEGILKEIDDIFFLHRKEIKKIVLDKSDLEITALIKSRRDDFLKYEYIIPPKFLHGNREFDDLFRYSEDHILFKGIPASQGIFTAKIRVLNKIEDIQAVQKGEILVVPKTDPGWTPVFSKIGGLITETGGILSHGAVVSREYGVPSVTNITNACQLFKTGQIVTINGYNGSVIIKK
jgi:pyruvate,water dikinase